MASSPFRPKRKETKKSEVKENRVRAAVRRAVRWLRKRFAKNVGKQNSPRVLGAYLAEGQQEDDSLEDLIKQLSSHEKLHAYHLGDVIGHGGYGFVISGTRKADNLPVAMKFVKRSSVLEFIKVEGKPVPSEIYFTNKAKHRYVIKLYQGLTLENYFVYVMERPENCQDLYDVLCNRRLSEKEARRYFSQIVEATICCEENGVVHRDLKLGNILLDKTSDEIKMIDFGLASKMQYEPYHKFRGTKTHMPPEFVRFGWYDGCQSTVWALGITLFNLVSSRMAFNKPEEALERKPRMPVHLSEDAKDLIFSMLNINPFNRPSVKQILKHPWMTVRDPVDDVSSTPIAPAAFNLQSSTSDEEPASCYALAASRSESICITTSLAASKGHDGHNGSERHKDGKLQNARADHKDTMDSENCPLNGKYQGKLNPLRKDKLDRLDRGFRLNTFERQSRTSNQGTFYTQRESNENNKFTQCGCLHDIHATARFPRDIRKRKTRPSSVISIEMDLYHVHWKDKRNAKQGTKIPGKRKPGIEDKKTKWALARQIDKCYYMVEELKARRNMIKLRNFIAGITESGLFPNSLGRNARGRPESCNTNKYSVRGNKMSFKHVMHEERFTFEPKCRMAITRHADKRGFRHCRKRILKKPP